MILQIQRDFQKERFLFYKYATRSRDPATFYFLERSRKMRRSFKHEQDKMDNFMRCRENGIPVERKITAEEKTIG